MASFLCNNFLLEMTQHIHKYPSIKMHTIIVWVIKVIPFAFLSLQDLFKSRESSRLKKKKRTQLKNQNNNKTPNKQAKITAKPTQQQKPVKDAPAFLF